VIKRQRLLLIACAFISVVGLALGLARWSSPVYANVTLVSFTATYLSGKQEMRIDWETATELDTVGFYVARSNSFTGPFAHVSPFIPHEGDTVLGATYVYTDGIPALNQTYYYLLEAVNADQTIDPHGPITATAGVPATNTPTATSTRTRTPTFTPTTRPSAEASVPPATSSRRIEATPRVPSGATITPRPTFVSQPPSPAVFPATPTLASAPANSQPNAPIVTSALPFSNVSPLATAVPPPPAATNIGQASAPAIGPAEATPGVAAPVVVATEAAPPAAPADSARGDAFILIVAAILFLGIAFVILRQARQ
jgi:hypothetical protein